MINKKRLIDTTRSLIRIKSENPPGDERAIVRFIASYFKKRGVSSKIFTFYKNRDNIYFQIKGKKSKKELLVTPHLDTVPAGTGWKFPPFSGVLKNGKIYGRGATDCKGNLAVAMEVFTSLIEDSVEFQNSVSFLATADEETGSQKGLLPFLEKKIIRPSFALVLDSDEFNIITAQKGLIHFRVKVSGKKSHGAYPERGVNAIDKALEMIKALKDIDLSWERHELLNPPTINIGTINGGDKVNMVADWCEFEVDLRFLPGMNAQKILSRIKKTFNKVYDKFIMQIDDVQEPYEIDTGCAFVSSLKDAARGITERSCIKGSEGATVITFFKKFNIPAVATGFGSSGCAHATDEYVRVSDLYRGSIFLEKFVKIFDKRR